MAPLLVRLEGGGLRRVDDWLNDGRQRGRREHLAPGQSASFRRSGRTAPAAPKLPRVSVGTGVSHKLKPILESNALSPPRHHTPPFKSTQQTMAG
jgi:hypothetical protein